jgi:hypothetical protein
MYTLDINRHRQPAGLFLSLVGAVLLLQCGGDDNPTEPPPPDPEYTIEAVNGDRYRGLMGSDIFTPDLSFLVKDTAGDPAENVTVRLSLVTGDGTLAASSLATAANGTVSPGFTFDGSLGHAILRAAVGNTDSVDVNLRANTLIPGASGQFQYLLVDETYFDVLAWNGTPNAIAKPESCLPNQLIFLDYETTLGVVFNLSDLNNNSVADFAEPVIGAFFALDYEPVTSDGLGIGSSFSELEAVYGAPDDTVGDFIELPPAWVYKYDSPYMNWWVDTLADTVFQIDFYKSPPCPGAAAFRRR